MILFIYLVMYSLHWENCEILKPKVDPNISLMSRVYQIRSFLLTQIQDICHDIIGSNLIDI